MPDVLQVGFLMIRLDWLLVGISGVAGYFAMKHKFKKTDFAERPVLDKLFNALIIVFLVWKLSHMLSTPSMLWTMPFGLLVIPGNAVGGWRSYFVFSPPPVQKKNAPAQEGAKAGVRGGLAFASSSLHRHAAVDDDRTAGHVGGFVAADK